MPGSFIYSPALGTTLNSGDNLLTATFTPNDPVTYAGASISAHIQGGLASGTSIYGYSITYPNGSSGYDPAGNIIAYTDTVNGQWTAGYDTLNRLTSATQALTPTQLTNGVQISTPWGNAAQQFLCWQYDSFGNRDAQASSSSAFTDPAGCTNPNPASTAFAAIRSNFGSGGNPGNNQINGISQEGSSGPQLNISAAAGSYDAAGNLIDDGIFQYQYDAESRLCAVRKGVTGTMTGYLYDAEGNRVAKGSITPTDPLDRNTWCNLATNGFTPATHDIFGPGGGKLVELDGNDAWLRTNVYANGELVATYDPPTSANPLGLHYHFSDWLGTRRLQTDTYGDPEETCMGNPFGEANCTGADTTDLHFTGKERDTETASVPGKLDGLDDFGARYYASSLGKWMSPDWAGKAQAIPYADLTDPQSLNLYTYLRNNPLRSADLDGHDDYEQSDFWYGGEWESLNEAMKDERNQVQTSNAAAQQQSAQVKQVGDAFKKGADIGNDITSELGLTKIWYDIMQTATDNALGAPESGLGEETVYDARVADYAQAQVMYHGTLAGLKWQDLQNGIITGPKPIPAFVQWVNTLWNAPLLSQEKATVDTTRQNMVDAHEDYVRAATAMYGSQQ